MDAFLTIESILTDHHKSTREPMRVDQLRFRAFQKGITVTLQTIKEILSIWPQAYRLSMSRGYQVIEILGGSGPERCEKFESLWKEKENLAAKPTSRKAQADANVSNCVSKSSTTINQSAAPQVKLTRKALRPILVGNQRKYMAGKDQAKSTPLDFLARVRASHARLQNEQNTQNVERIRDQFLRSQVPKLKRCLSELTITQTHRSLQMSEAMDILRTNLFKLSDEEISRCLGLAVQMFPHFFSIVKVGEQEHVKIRREQAIC